MTNQGADPVGADELWTPKQAAEYLNAGGVHLGFTSRRVADMIRSGTLVGTRTGDKGWHRTPASAVRQLRAQQLTAIGRTDPQADQVGGASRLAPHDQQVPASD